MNFDINKLEELFPQAYKALPECYKEDSCLVFFIDNNDNLCAEFDLGGEFLSTEDSKWIELPRH